MRVMLKSKIHRARVTAVNVDYEGSIAIDEGLMHEADIMPYEQVQVLNVNNGERFTTYAIPGKQGEISVNGAAARLAAKGDIVIIITYSQVEDEAAADFMPKVVCVDTRNRITLAKELADPVLFEGIAMRISINQIREMKAKGEKISMLTAYDYATGRLIDEVGIPLILVGDSLGMVVLGYESTIPVTMEDMLHHTKSVVRGAKRALVVGDLPFMTYASLDDALSNAARFIQEAGAQAVKLEGGVTVAERVRAIVNCGIPVMGHIGLTPQSINQLGGYKVQGKTPESARRLLGDALALEAAGAFAVVLETVPTPLATLITRRLAIPTIGIGAGAGCDGQVQVVSDMLGLYTDFVPKHAKQYARLADIIRTAVSDYDREVKSGLFPTEKQSFSMDESILAELEKR